MACHLTVTVTVKGCIFGWDPITTRSRSLSSIPAVTPCLLHHSITPSLPQLPGQGSKRGGESSTTSASLKRNREDDDVRNVVEVFPVDGVSGRLVNYFTDQMGEIVVADVRKGNIDVLFHVNQVQGTLISQVWG